MKPSSRPRWKLCGAAQDLAGETVLITAGPTREPIDPVRYHRQSLQREMGYALAEAALRRGAKVILVSGPRPSRRLRAEVTRVETAEQMRDAVLNLLPEATIVIKAAAVADYRPKPPPQKIKRKGPMTLELEPTRGHSGRSCGARKPHQLIIGFAAETQNALENARKKLAKKSLDAIVVNDVSREASALIPTQRRDHPHPRRSDRSA